MGMDIAQLAHAPALTTMSTIVLLDLLFFLIAAVAGVLAFGVATSRFTETFKMIFFLFVGLFLLTLLAGYLPKARQLHGAAAVETADQPTRYPYTPEMRRDPGARSLRL